MVLLTLLQGLHGSWDKQSLCQGPATVVKGLRNAGRLQFPTRVFLVAVWSQHLTSLTFSLLSYQMEKILPTTDMERHATNMFIHLLNQLKHF